MRVGIFAFLAAVCFAASAAAQTSITLTADPVPIVEAEINGRPVRLEVDPRMPDMLALSTPAAERLGVRRIPFAAVGVGIEGGGSMRGRIARPRISFGQRAARNFAGIFGVPVSTRADGVVGPGSLPYDIITINLGPAPAQARQIVFPLEDADIWYSTAQVGGETLQIEFALADDASVFNRSAARLFDRAGAIPSAGDLIETPVILGLSTMMQPVTTQLTLEGLALGPTFARTNSPLLGALEEDAIVVEAEGNAPPPNLVLGRAALRDAGCSSISVDRRTRRLTLTCAG